MLPIRILYIEDEILIAWNALAELKEKLGDTVRADHGKDYAEMEKFLASGHENFDKIFIDFSFPGKNPDSKYGGLDAYCRGYEGGYLDKIVILSNTGRNTIQNAILTQGLPPISEDQILEKSEYNLVGAIEKLGIAGAVRPPVVKPAIAPAPVYFAS